MDKLKTRHLPKYLMAKHTTNVSGTIRQTIIVPIGLNNKVFIKAESVNATTVSIICLDAGHASIGADVKDAVIKLTCAAGDRGTLIRDLTNVIAGVGTNNPNDGANSGVIRLDGDNLSTIPSSVNVTGLSIDFNGNA